MLGKEHMHIERRICPEFIAEVECLSGEEHLPFDKTFLYAVEHPLLPFVLHLECAVADAARLEECVIHCTKDGRISDRLLLCIGRNLKIRHELNHLVGDCFRHEWIPFKIFEETLIFWSTSGSTGGKHQPDQAHNEEKAIHGESSLKGFHRACNEGSQENITQGAA